jgi:Protein of unknown function (DUF3617)
LVVGLSGFCAIVHVPHLVERASMRTLLLPLLLIGPMALAQTPPIKPGLWETTSGSMLLNGQPMPGMEQMHKQLAQLPPEVRRKMQAQGVDLGGDGKLRVCLSAEMLKQDRWQQAPAGCSLISQERSGNHWRFKGRCTQPPGEVEGTTTVQGDSAHSSEVKVTTQRDGKPFVMTMKSSSRWIASDCGAVKPLGHPAIPK